MQHMIEWYPGIDKDFLLPVNYESGPVWSCNEWDPLEEVIVGTSINARYPHFDKSTHIAEYSGKDTSKIPQGNVPSWIIDETEEDLSTIIDEFKKLDIRVKRPSPLNNDIEISSYDWKTKGFYNYCPRDILLAIGDQIIETPNTIRGRYLESHSYRRILLDYMRQGTKWFSAPKPMLLDSTFDVDQSKPVPKNVEPIFDAANVLRCGRDLVYLISSTGNELGAKWLQSVLGKDFRVHICRIDYHGSHIDTSIVLLKPGLLLCNPERVNKSMLPSLFNSWEVIYSPPMVEKDVYGEDYLNNCIGSNWIDMNLFSISPNLVVIDKDQVPLIRLLEKKGIDTLQLKLRHSRMLGGGFHCSTLDVKRRGKLESYL